MTTAEALAWVEMSVDKREEWLGANIPDWTTDDAAFAAELAANVLAAEVRRLRGDDLPLCSAHMEYAKSHHGECFGCDLAAARAEAARLREELAKRSKAGLRQLKALAAERDAHRKAMQAINNTPAVGASREINTPADVYTA